MLHISHLSFSYQNQTIFQNLNLSLSNPDVVAIIGDNGVGKTTLLRLIARELQADDGAIRTKGDIGFLHQNQDETNIKQSGGEYTQTELTKLFRSSPRILLLDEPTNNLDHESKKWLVNQLHKYHGLTLIVSHDRNFIDAVAHKIIEICDGNLHLFHGNYSDFLDSRAQSEHEQYLAYEKTQRQKKRLTQRLTIANDRVHKTSRHSFNKTIDESKLLHNTRRMDAQKTSGKILRATQSKLDQLSDIAKPVQRKVYAAQLTHDLSRQKALLKITNLSKSYANKTLFQNLNFTVATGERIRVTGRNGAGKSTLFQIITGAISADSGEIRFSPNVKVGYVSQGNIDMNPDQSFLACHHEFNPTEIYRAAITMDFSAQDINRPARELSRGQLTKLAILKLILNPLDLVILDEITNHLDIRAQENIESALQNYHGAILAATHDEAFAKKIGFSQSIDL